MVLFLKNIRFFNAITHCIPGATLQTNLNKLNQMLPTLPATVTKIVLHVGTNNATRRESIRTMKEFNLLFNVLKACGKSIFISGPLPTLNRDIEQFNIDHLTINPQNPTLSDHFLLSFELKILACLNSERRVHYSTVDHCLRKL
uniref:SGNH hydrolase-type esterase domain-containing protein n=1 Tax=Gouania willdenowi TaxID=441366 RepID=A0A8C5D730_GOUWI